MKQYWGGGYPRRQLTQQNGWFDTEIEDNIQSSAREKAENSCIRIIRCAAYILLRELTRHGKLEDKVVARIYILAGDGLYRIHCQCSKIVIDTKHDSFNGALHPHLQVRLDYMMMWAESKYIKEQEAWKEPTSYPHAAKIFQKHDKKSQQVPIHATTINNNGK